jgi:DinB family protein
MTTDSQLRAHLHELIRGGHAHVTFDDAIAELPASLRGTRPDSLPYSPWELVEHIRIAQRDILDYAIARSKADYRELEWPKGYWPKSPAPSSGKAWDDAIAAVRADREEMERLVQDADLFAKLPAATEGHTVLRQALLLADHNAYHIGELVAVRRLLGAWR